MKLGNSGYGYSSIVVITILRPHCHSAVWCAAIVRLCERSTRRDGEGEGGGGGECTLGATAKEPNKYEENRPGEEKLRIVSSKLHAIILKFVSSFSCLTLHRLALANLYSLRAGFTIYFQNPIFIVSAIAALSARDRSLFERPRVIRRQCRSSKLAVSVILLQRQIERRCAPSEAQLPSNLNQIRETNTSKMVAV